MRETRIDLHNHTPHVWSDYRSPDSTAAALVDAALAAGIEVLGVTDHFTVGGFRAIERAAAGAGLLALPGAEIKVAWEGDECHLIALFDPADGELRFEELMSLLRFPHLPEGIEELPRLVVERDPVEVAFGIEALGGMVHLAHADRAFAGVRFIDSPAFDRLVRMAPLAALEFLSLDAYAEELARCGGLRAIQSSDAHDPAQMGRRSSLVPMRDLSFAALRETLRPQMRPGVGALVAGA